MIYSDLKGLRLFALGFSVMRLQVIDGDDSRVDQAVVDTMVDYAMEHGANYFDTAYSYHGEMSKVSIEKALSCHSRDSYYLADEFLRCDMSNMSKVKEVFEE